MDNKPRRRSSRQVPRSSSKNRNAATPAKGGARGRQAHGVSTRQASNRRRTYTMFGGVAAAAIILAIILIAIY